MLLELQATNTKNRRGGEHKSSLSPLGHQLGFFFFLLLFIFDIKQYDYFYASQVYLGGLLCFYQILALLASEAKKSLPSLSSAINSLLHLDVGKLNFLITFIIPNYCFSVLDSVLIQSVISIILADVLALCRYMHVHQHQNPCLISILGGEFSSFEVLANEALQIRAIIYHAEIQAFGQSVCTIYS